MFFKNKETKRAVRDWVRQNFSGVQGHGLDTFIGKVVDLRSSQKKRLVLMRRSSCQLAALTVPLVKPSPSSASNPPLSLA